MELWQIIVVVAFAIAVEIYICGVFFFAGWVADEDNNNFKQELVAAFIAAIFWPLIIWFYDWFQGFRFRGKKSNQ